MTSIKHKKQELNNIKIEIKELDRMREKGTINAVEYSIQMCFLLNVLGEYYKTPSYSKIKGL